MADQSIIRISDLPDTPGLNSTADEMVVDNAANGTRRIPVGRANGVATLNAAGVVAEAVGNRIYSSIATAQTTAAINDGPSLAITLSRTGIVIVMFAATFTDVTGAPRHGLGLYLNGTLSDNYYYATYFYANGNSELHGGTIITASAGDTLEMRVGIWPTAADGTNEIKFWTPRLWVAEIGAE